MTVLDLQGKKALITGGGSGTNSSILLSGISIEKYR